MSILRKWFAADSTPRTSKIAEQLLKQQQAFKICTACKTPVAGEGYNPDTQERYYSHANFDMSHKAIPCVPIDPALAALHVGT